MSNRIVMTSERLHDLHTVLTYEEIKELRNICYENGSSWCPISDFFNDIEINTDKDYNKNQAFKDLWLIVNIVLEKEKKLKALAIIKEKGLSINEIIFIKNEESWETYIETMKELYWGDEVLEKVLKTKEEYDLLKEILYVQKEENRT